MNLVFFFSFLFLLLRLFIECGPMHAAAVVESENLQELVGSPLLPQVSRDLSQVFKPSAVWWVF